jgi:hypothetical protein
MITKDSMSGNTFMGVNKKTTGHPVVLNTIYNNLLREINYSFPVLQLRFLYSPGSKI